MRRRIEKPRILLLDCGLEYTKGESQTNIEVTKEGDFSRLLELEEECVTRTHTLFFSLSHSDHWTYRSVDTFAASLCSTTMVYSLASMHVGSKFLIIHATPIVNFAEH